MKMMKLNGLHNFFSLAARWIQVLIQDDFSGTTSTAC
jgi:hypothetical protein